MKAQSQNNSSSFLKMDGGKSKSNAFEVPSRSLPHIKCIREKFPINAVNGTTSFGIPLPLSAARLTPSVGLGYSSGGGNSPFGLGWQLGIPSITRKADKNLPKYRDEVESNTFILSGAEDLVRILEKQQNGEWKKTTKEVIEEETTYTVFAYRPRIEGLFVRIECWNDNATGIIHWHTISKDTVHSY